MFLVNQWFIFVIFTSVAPHRGQPAAKYHLRWQPIRRLAVSCGLGRHRIRTRDCRTTVWHATIELPCLPFELPCLPITNTHASVYITTSFYTDLNNYILQECFCSRHESQGLADLPRVQEEERKEKLKRKAVIVYVYLFACHVAHPWCLLLWKL